MYIIETRQLRKRYGAVDVLHGIDLRVRRGKLTGFLGPNGAGKSTTIRILAGLISASGGSAMVRGMDCATRGPEIRREIGYLPGEVRLYPAMTGLATLGFCARARKRDCHAEINRLATVFELDLARRTRQYSSGMKQKLALIQAMMHRPELLILDEPTTGLDPLVRQSVFAELRRYVAEGGTVLFSSHSLNEVEMLCDDVVILREGRVIEQQSIEVLRQQALRRVTMTFTAPSDVPAAFPTFLQVIDQTALTVRATQTGELDALLQWLRQPGLQDVIIEPPDLEDFFLACYGGGRQPASELAE